MADLTGGIWYTIRHRFARRIRRARNRGNDMSRKREEQAKGGVSHGKCDAHAVLVGTYKGDIQRFKEVA